MPDAAAKHPVLETSFGTTFLIVAVLGARWLIVQQIDRFVLAQLTGTFERRPRGRVGCSRPVRSSQAKSGSSGQKVEGIAGELRVTLILKDGTVLAGSVADPRARSRMPIARRLSGHGRRLGRRDALLPDAGEGDEIRGLARRAGGRSASVVRVAMEIRTIGRQEGAVQNVVWTIICSDWSAAIVFAMGLARVWSHPIAGSPRSPKPVRGDLSARVYVAGHDEMGMLARSLNEMRDSLAEQLSTIDRQRRTLQSLLTQLREVIVSGADGRILLIILPLLACWDDRSCRRAAGSFAGRPVEHAFSP